MLQYCFVTMSLNALLLSEISQIHSFLQHKTILPHEAMKLMFKHHLSATWPRRKRALPRHPLITCIKTHNPQLGLLCPAS